MSNQLLALSWKEVDDGHFHHGVAAWLLAHGSAGYANEHCQVFFQKGDEEGEKLAVAIQQNLNAASGGNYSAPS